MPLDEVLYPVDERGCRISTPDSEDPDMERERPRRACTACSPPVPGAAHTKTAAHRLLICARPSRALALLGHTRIYKGTMMTVTVESKTISADVASSAAETFEGENDDK